MIISRLTIPVLLIAIASALAIPEVANAGITMTLDRDSVDFRTMENGQTAEISDQGVYHNEIVCTSTNNKTWYLKANLIRPLSSGMYAIPSDNFKWKIVDLINGKGIIYNNINVATPFMGMPSLVYTSDPVDNTGTEIKLRFRYVLTIPKNQAAGNYFGSVRWTMTELL